MRKILAGVFLLILAGCGSQNIVTNLFSSSHPYAAEFPVMAETTELFQPGEPVLWNAESLRENKQRMEREDPDAILLKNRFNQLGRHYLQLDPPTIIDKPQIHAEQTPNDYVSMGMYWWPNPRTSDGLPYVRRDGEANPEAEKLDYPKLAIFSAGTTTLAQAWYFTGNEDYAERAYTYLNTWFCEPETRMNPHLRFSQGVPGRHEGRGSGIIDTYHFTELLDAIYLLQNNDSWPAETLNPCLQNWFTDLLDWMLTSDLGRDEVNARNNHGTWYDAQVVAYATFVGKNDLARHVLENSVPGRIDRHINIEGRQPREMSRTKGVEYSMYNLEAYHVLVRYGRLYDIHLLGRETSRSAGLLGAVNYMNEIVLNQDASQNHRQNWIVERSRMLQETARIPRADFDRYVSRLHRKLAGQSFEVID